MRTLFDYFAKLVAESALSSSCKVETSERIASEVMEIDAWVTPDPKRATERARAGLLGRMCAELSSIEAFHNRPSLLAIDECYAKRTLKHADLRRTAERVGERDPPRAQLWFVVAEPMNTVLRQWKAEPMLHWPQGCYEAAPGACLHFVVVPELPQTRETLLVRMMGLGQVLRAAWKEFKALPDDAWERKVLLPVFAFVPLTPLEGQTHTIDDEEVAMTYQEMQQVYENTQRRARKEGIKKGRKKGLKKGLAPLVCLFQRKLDRPLSTEERATLVRRLDTHGPDRLGNVVIDLDAPVLAAWLADPDAK
jgi:hypothetical protein